MTKRNRSAVLLVGGSLLAIASGAASAQALPDGCAQNGGAVVCSPDGNPYPDGLSFSTPPVAAGDQPNDPDVPVQDLTVTLQPGVTVDTPDTVVGPGVALNGLNDGSVTLDASDAVSITTAGAGATGVLANATGGGVTLGVDTVATTGDFAGGVSAATISGNVAVDAGAVSTAGYGANGIDANAFTGDVSVGVGSVTTSGYAQGVNAVSISGDVAVAAGSVATGGVYGSAGIVAQSYFGDVRVAAGDVSTLGQASNAITASGANVDVAATGLVQTSGYGSYGVAAAGTGAITVDAARVVTRGDGATGVLALTQPPFTDEATPQDLTVRAGSVETRGLGSAGVVAVNTSGGAVSVTADSVATRRDGAVGVYGLSDGGAVRITVGDVETRGFRSLGVVGLGDSAGVTVTGSLSTLNDGARGVVAIGYAGDAAVDARSVATGGDGATAVSALASGDVSVVTRGAVSTTGAGSLGVYAHSAAGKVTADLGPISTAGADANGVTALGGTVDLTLRGPVGTAGDRSAGALAYSLGQGATITNAGAITTEGAFAYGVLAVGANALAVTNSGAITTKGDVAHGVYALSRVGDDRSVTVTSTGPVKTSGDLATGVKAIAVQGDISLDVAGVSTTGGVANGVLALSDRLGRGDYAGATVATTVQVRARDVRTSGEYSTGVAVQNVNGDVAVDAGGVTVTGRGSTAVSVKSDVGAAALTVSGAQAQSAFAAVYVDAAQRTVVNVTGAVSANLGGGLAVFGEAGNTITIAEGGSVSGGGRPFAGDPYAGGFEGDAVRVSTSYGDPAATVINNAGSIVQARGDGWAVHSFYGDLDLANTGRIVGAVRTERENATVRNAGVFEATKDSEFEGAADLFTNTGTLRVRPGAAAAGTVAFTGLERFENRGGLIDLRNGRVGDVFSLPGAYVGDGGRLALDVSFSGAGTGSADQLLVAGAATGGTAITLSTVGPGAATLLSTPVTLATVGAGSAADLFTLDPASSTAGFIQYGLAFDPATRSYGLTAAAGAPLYRLARANEGAENVWLKSAEAWSGRTAAIRDARWAATEGATGSRLWGQLAGGADKRDGGVPAAGPGGAAARVGTGYRQDHFGAQLGYDLVGGGAGGGGATVGVTGGYLNSTLRTSGERLSFDAANAGLYVGFNSGRFFVGALGKYDRYWVDANGRTLTFADRFHGASYGVQGEAGFRLGGATFFAEPIAGLAYVRTDLNDLRALGQVVDFDKADGLRGSAGVRIGGARALGAGRIVYYATGRAVREFEGKDGLTFRSGGLGQAIATSRLGTYGAASAGVSILSAGPVSGFIEAEGRFGSSYKGGGGRAGISVRF